MENIESHLDQVFTEGAKRLSDQVAGRRCNYRIDAMGYTAKCEDTGKTGICRILEVYYSTQLDCDIYVLLDEETKEEFSICQFEVILTDV